MGLAFEKQERERERERERESGRYKVLHFLSPKIEEITRKHQVSMILLIEIEISLARYRCVIKARMFSTSLIRSFALIISINIDVAREIIDSFVGTNRLNLHCECAAT